MRGTYRWKGERERGRKLLRDEEILNEEMFWSQGRKLTIPQGLTTASKDYQKTRMVILVPTKELAMQVTAFMKQLTVYCEGVVGVCNVSAGGAATQRYILSSLFPRSIQLIRGSVLLNDLPDILVSTATPLLSGLQNKKIDLSHLCFLVIDEADLLLSYGHKDDLMRMMDPASGFVPRLGVQGCLMSATLEGVESVKGLVLRNPVSYPQ